MDKFYDLLARQAFKISQLLTDYDVIGNGIEHAIDISGTVTKDTCDLKLYVAFVSTDSRKLSHTEMIEEGLLAQEDFDEISKAIAAAARKTSTFNHDGFLTFSSD